MENNCLRVVNYAQAVLPQPRAVVGVFIVSGFVSFVESSEPFPDRAGSHQKCGRAIIHIAAKHIHRREWSVAAAVSETGAIAPYDASGLLQGPIQQDQTSAHRSDIWRGSNRIERRC